MTTIDRFYKITGYKIDEYFNRFNSFIRNDYQSIVSYYRDSSNINNNAFSSLSNLITESNNISSLFIQNSTNLSNDTSFWDLIVDFEESKSKLSTIKNMYKWMRSSYIYGYSLNSKFNYILGKNESLENLSSNLGYIEYNNDWIDIALNNNLSEIDYSSDGGNTLKLSKSNNYQLNTTDVVDHMVGNNILGKDIFSKISIVDDDIVCLQPEDTFYQSASILLSVSRRSVPEFLNIGYDKSIVGSSVSQFRVSSLIRQISNNFTLDDSMAEISLIDIINDEDTIRYQFQIISRLNNELIVNL